MTTQATGFTGRRFGHIPIRTERDIEYDAFARVTRSLQQALRGDGSLAAAAAANVELWSALATDLADDGNALPVSLRGALLSLALFSVRHAQGVMTGERQADALIDVNLSIMKGLRGEAAA